MTRFALLYGQRWRRDLVQLTLWIAGTVALAGAAYAGVAQQFGTEQDRVGLLQTVIANPVILLFRGLPSGSDASSVMAFLILPFLALMAALMSTFLAVRHTRGDEEQQRTELVAATPAGRTMPFAATAVHGILANVVLGLLVTVTFVATGQAAGGAVAIGAASAATGIVFLAVALLLAQLVRTSRAANATSVWIVIIAFLACGIGNALGTPSDDLLSLQSSPLAWVSPFGWAENTRPWSTDDPRPLLLSLALTLVALAIAAALQRVRDVGGALLPERHGRANAPASLRGPISLAWRLSRGSTIGWMIGGLIAGLLATQLASVVSQLGDTIASVQALVSALSANGSLAQGAVVIFFTVVGVLAACAGVQTLNRARQDEAHGLAEPVRAGAVGRVSWVASYGVVAALAVVATAAAAVLGAVVGLAGQSDPDWSLAGDAVISGAGQIPAALVFVVITALVLVVAPRLTILVGWTLVLLGLILGLFGPLFGLPDAVVNLSPVAVTPIVDSGGIDARGVWWLVAIAVVGAVGALALARGRELEADG
ncbi:polyketide antibiotic transporter [Microbacterium sp. NPDC091313]